MKAGLLAGKPIKALARELGLGRSTVQEHAKRLLLAGAIVKAEGRYFPGPGRGVPVAGGHTGHTPVPGGGTQRPAPPQRIDVATDGRRTFRVTMPPADVTRLAGFVASKPKGPRKPVVQMLHQVVHADAGGHTWNLWLDQSLSQGRWSLWVGKVLPPPRFADFQKPGETPDDAFDRLAVRTVMEWAAKAGVGLVPVPRRSRPVAVTFPGTMPPGVVYRGLEQTSDGTPPHPNGWNTLEIQGNDAERTRQHQEAHLVLPETTAKVDAFDASLSRIDRALVALAERYALALELDLKLATVGNLRDLASLSPSTKRPLSTETGVEIQ